MATALEQMRQPAHRAGQRRTRNVGKTERVLSALVGGGLASFGLAKRGLAGWTAVVAGGSLLYRGISGHCPLLERLGIDTSESKNPAIGVRAQHGIKLEKTILVSRSPDELYRFWRDLENLPSAMHHLVAVRESDDKHSHWVARGPLNTTVEWDSEIINERENEMIAWRSIPGGDVDTAGSVHFEKAPHGRGTKVHVSLKYEPPGGKAGLTLARLLGDGLERQLEADLHHFKSLMEAGELATTEGQPRGPSHPSRAHHAYAPDVAPPPHSVSPSPTEGYRS